MKSVRTILVLVGGILLLPTLCQGKIPDGLLCDECHTMHNSQGGQAMSWNTVRNPMLLRNTCLGCHTGTNEAGGYIPYVLATTPPTYGVNTLAGGNFYWVAEGDNRLGHNVIYLNVDNNYADSELPSPPGYASTAPAWTDSTLTCAGPQGCHGKREVADEGSDLRDPLTHLGAHHTDDSQPLDGSTVGKSYRFLDGVIGLEDTNWERTKSASKHNQYMGKARSSDTDDATSYLTSTDGSISSLCAKCHGDFHNGTVQGNVDGGTWGSPWVRHPTDFDMNDATGTEYGSYGGVSHDYNPDVPLGSNDVSLIKSEVLQGSGDAIVMCLSCHRAHGSPNEAILRWDFRGWPGSGESYGCFTCHTTKD